MAFQTLSICTGEENNSSTYAIGTVNTAKTQFGAEMLLVAKSWMALANNDLEGIVILTQLNPIALIKALS